MQDTLTLSVSELTEHIQSALSAALPPCWVQGELSNVVPAQSGHLYFSLKDAHSQIRCVIWKTTAQGLAAHVRAQLTNGQTIHVRGVLTVYKPRGEYQIVVKELNLAGQGDLYAQFLALKDKLQQAGLFEQHTTPLPTIPHTVGIITSLKTAALRDILVTLQQHRPQLCIIIYPCPVQGAQAAAAIVRAIQLANQRQEVNTLILARGGGSLEDLWCFNDEQVVRAIHASQLPIITGIGHESDITLADWAAHYRAATPTAAAQAVSLSQAVIQQQLNQYVQRAQACIQQKLMHLYQQKDLQEARLKQHSATQRLQHYRLQLTRQHERLRHLITTRYRQLYYRWQQLCTRLQQQKIPVDLLRERINKNRMALRQALATRLAAIRALHDRHCHQLCALNPKAVLSRGYSITVKKQNPSSPLTKDTALQPGDTLLSFFDWGQITSTVIDSDR